MPDDILKRIDQNRAIISKHRPFDTPETLKAIREYYDAGLVWSSNALEGFSYTMSETELLMREGIVTGGKRYRDTCAVVNLKKALDSMYGLAPAREVTESDILEFHRLLGDSLGNDAVLGAYRDARVYVGDEELPMPEKVPGMLSGFYGFLENERERHHPAVFAALAHLKFVAIHPFADGNGRVSRMILNTVLIQNGYLPVTIVPAEHRRYNEAIRSSKQHDLGGEFVTFICQKESDSQKDFIRFMKFDPRPADGTGKPARRGQRRPKP
ncbi:MAG: Fic family protein [Deltaproteobacteria bacterium]|jgi:Fic family protein|nr:Fic family protein [Deltaproteobacteria bacterium]